MRVNKAAFSAEISTFYTKLSSIYINKEITKAFIKVAKKLAKQVVEQYDMKQMIEQEVEGPGNKIIITTVFEKKNEKTKNT